MTYRSRQSGQRQNLAGSIGPSLTHGPVPWERTTLSSPSLTTLNHLPLQTTLPHPPLSLQRTQLSGSGTQISSHSPTQPRLPCLARMCGLRRPLFLTPFHHWRLEMRITPLLHHLPSTPFPTRFYRGLLQHHQERSW